MSDPPKKRKPKAAKSEGTGENPKDERPRTPRKRQENDTEQKDGSKKKPRKQLRSPSEPARIEDVPPPPKRGPAEPKLLSTRPAEAPKPPIDAPPATLTGFRELKISSAFLVTLLWLPRFFIPWITAWHEFTVFVTSNPYRSEHRQGELNKNELFAFACSCFIAIASAVVYERFQKRFDMKYYLYIVLLILFTLSPVVGGFVDVILRAGFIDSQLYFDLWFPGLALMSWVMSFSFAMFPTQFACIYAQNNNMSRNAHYNWTAIFVFSEFLNAYVAFWVIPPKCPTRDWVQVVVWAGIGMLLITVTMMCLIFFFAAPALKHVMLKCLKIFRKKGTGKDDDTSEQGPFVSLPPDLRNKKVMWCSAILLPIVVSYFSFAVLERFVPDEDWDKHYLWSATSLFFMGRMLGVVVMVLVMFGVRKGLKKYPKFSIWRAEMFYMGVPHVFSILAFLALFGRFATLSHLKEGDVILGPIPDDEKTVLLMFNMVFRNRTICISSEYFRPVKIRPFHYATRELYDVGVDSFVVNVTVDPCSDLRLQSHFVVDNFTKGDWVVFGMSLLPTNVTKEYVWDYYSRIVPIRLVEAERLKPKGLPQIVVFSVSKYFPRSRFFHQFNHSSLAPVELTVANEYDLSSRRGVSAVRQYAEPRKPVIFDVPATGTWKATTSSFFHNITPLVLDWTDNATFLKVKEEFTVENYSLYYLVEYHYRELDKSIAWNTDGTSVPDFQYPGHPQGFKLFQVAEIAGPNSGRLPQKRELQQDWAIKLGLTLAGMAAGGLFHGFIYLFWVDPPIPTYRTTTLAVCWVFMGAGAEIPKIKLVDITVGVSIALTILHIASTALHFAGAYFMYNPAMNSRKRAD